MNHNNWVNMSLADIATEYGDGEPLDGDDVEDLVNILRIKINFHQGNMTEEEYEQGMKDLPALMKVDNRHCPKCGEHWVVHDGDGGCPED